MYKSPLALSTAATMLLASGCGASNETSSEIAYVRDSSRDRVSKNSRDTIYDDLGERNVHCRWQGKNGSHLDSKGFIVTGDFIYWRASEDNLQYASKVDLRSGSSRAKLTTFAPNVSWDPGFKIGVGYTGEKDFWDLYLNWTHFNTHQSGHHSYATGSNIAINPWWISTATGILVSGASVNWKLHYNTLDLELGRDYFIGKSVTVRPHLGLRGATIHQRYKATYSGLTAANGDTFMKAHNNFKGLGARAGAGMLWHFTSHFGLTGSISGSLMYGQFKVKENVRGFFTGVGVLIPTNKETLTTLATNLDAGIGLLWETFFSRDRYRCAISVAYEFSEWFSQNQMDDFELNDSANVSGAQHRKVNGNLGLQGGTLEVRFDF